MLATQACVCVILTRKWKCFIHDKELGYDKVNDYCHNAVKHLRAAHDNLYKKIYAIQKYKPIIFQNLRRYDSHFKV